MTIKELKETAALAHLDFDESELAEVFPAFEQMLEYFAVMQAADEDRAAFPGGLASSDSGNPQTASSGFFRPDSVNSLSNNEDLINNAGKRDERFLVIPSVLEK